VTGAGAAYSASGFTGNLTNSLPLLQYFGASPTLLNQVVTWANSIWPSFSWEAALNEVCTVGAAEATTLGPVNDVTCK